MWTTLLIVFVALVVFAGVLSVHGARRAKALRGLGDPMAPTDGAQRDSARRAAARRVSDHEVQTAQAKAARPDSGVGGMSVF